MGTVIVMTGLHVCENIGIDGNNKYVWLVDMMLVEPIDDVFK